MKNILIIIAILMLPATTLAGTFDMGAESIRADEQTETSYYLGLGYEKSGASLDIGYNYGKLDDLVITDDGWLSLGYDADLSDKWGIWLDETVQYDRPGGVKVENFIGLGPKYTLYRSKTVKSSLSFGYLSHYQVLIDGDEYTLERWSWRFKIKRKDDKSETGFISMYQPAIGNSDDYIFDNSVWHSIYVTESVDIKLSIDSEARPDAHKVRQMATVVYKFGN